MGAMIEFFLAGRLRYAKEVCKNKIPFLKWSGRIGRQKG